jgi:hypothetical protein
MDCLATVDWAALTHAYGPASDLPDQLRALASADPSTRAHAYAEVDSKVCHQGSRFEATAHVAPFLIDLADDPRTPDRHRVLKLLAALAIGFDRWCLPASYPVADVRSDVEHNARLTAEELEQERNDWVAAAPTKRIRTSRAADAETRELTEERDAQRWALEAYDAVRRGVGAYCDALGSDDPEVQLWAAYLLGWFPEERGTSLPPLVQRLQAELDSSVAATAAIATGLIAHSADSAVWRALVRRLRAERHVESWGAAIALARMNQSPDRAVAQALYRCVRHAEPLVAHRIPYLEGDLPGLAALTLAELDADAAPERLDVIADRLGGWSASRPADAMVSALLKIAFPGGFAPEDAAYDELTPSQRKAVLALATAPGIWAYYDTRVLVGEFGLPDDEKSLRRYAGVPQEV